jgi:quinol monooxygenase YgiN
MIVVAGLARLKPESREAAKPLIEGVVAATRPEPGCISYTMHPTPEGVFVFEEWESDAHLQAHLAAPHTRTFLERIGPCLVEPPPLVRYEVAERAPLFG